ncbi:MAG: heme-binding protein [Patescibacteria group bacterium]
MIYYIFGAVMVVMLLWVAGSYLVIWNIEEPAYTVLEKKDGYEIRKYDSYIQAQTVVAGTYNEATEQGFRIIADYIFGNNVRTENISMTTPVLETPNQPEKIAMTVPVLESSADTATRTIAFVLPSKYSLATLPTPNNPAVTIAPIPSRTVAVLRYTWYPTEARTETKKQLLMEYLARDNKTITGAIETARYNPPLSMPLTLRNEIIIPIQANE